MATDLGDENQLTYVCQSSRSPESIVSPPLSSDVKVTLRQQVSRCGAPLSKRIAQVAHSIIASVLGFELDRIF